ncbi:MAG: DUF3343 domain-containing protein [Eubacterium sp.]|nr:DUF3343 domain-containing protein [Eubacterium sp.]
MLYIVKVGTITNAQRAKYALKSKGYKVNITRIAKPKSGDGCGYALEIVCSDVDDAVKIIENENIMVRGVAEL